MRLPRRLPGPGVLEFRAILKQGGLSKSVLNTGGRIFKALLSVLFLHYMFDTESLRFLVMAAIQYVCQDG